MEDLNILLIILQKCNKVGIRLVYGCLNVSISLQNNIMQIVKI